MKIVRSKEASSKKALTAIVWTDDQVRLKEFLINPARKQMISISGIERQVGLSQGVVSNNVLYDFVCKQV